jgi:hypothetical protein
MEKTTTIFTYENLYRAYSACRKNKRGTVNALKFELNLENNLADLLVELKSNSYRPGRSICFVVAKPSPREIFAADFRDRIVHHLLVREILPGVEKSLFYNSFACRRGKGTHKAVEALKRYAKTASSGYRNEIFYLQLDVKNFFCSIKHDILFNIFEKFIERQDKTDEWKEEVLWLGSVIIFYEPQNSCVIRGDRDLFSLIPKHKSLFHVPVGQGLPIGNYSSQFFANLYLNQLDYFIKQKIKAKYYVRYVDDLVILGHDKCELLPMIASVNDFLKQNLLLELNIKKTKLNSVEKGIDFLGYFLKPGYTLVRRRVISNCKEKIRMAGTVSPKVFVSQMNSYLGHFGHAQGWGLRGKVLGIK